MSINIKTLTAIPTPSFHEKADKLLLAIEKQTEYAGKEVYIKSILLSDGYCVNDEEQTEIYMYMKTIGYIEFVVSGTFKIAPNGWARLEEIKELNPDSEQCFVAMWFDDSMKDIYYNTITPAIEDAGYRPHRVDQREHAEKIDDEIIAQIRRSRFIIADFTGHRGGVYYEAGFAQGLGLEVIWTCNIAHENKLHFDIRQYNCIIWNNDDLEDFRKRLTFRIESIFGKGTYKRPE